MINHERGLRTENKDNVLHQHKMEDHPNEEDMKIDDFEIKVTGIYKKPLDRLAAEGCLIMKEMKTKNCMNPKEKSGIKIMN